MAVSLAELEAERQEVHRLILTASGDTHELLVCHGNVIRWFVCRALGVDTKQWTRMEIANCSLTMIQIRADGTVRVVAPVDAVSRLGLDIIRSLVLAEHVFGSCTAIDWQSERWWSHSMAIAHAARAIARCEQANHDLSVSCFTAGLLHDCGHLLMPRDDAGEAIDAGSMHAEIGAYLLGLWGLPDAVVETVAWHHAPGQGGATAFNPLMAVHVAQHLVVPAQSEDPTTLDAEWLTACGMHGRIEAWRAAVAEDAASA